MNLTTPVLGNKTGEFDVDISVSDRFAEAVEDDVGCVQIDALNAMNRAERCKQLAADQLFNPSRRGRRGFHLRDSPAKSGQFNPPATITIEALRDPKQTRGREEVVMGAGPEELRGEGYCFFGGFR